MISILPVFSTLFSFDGVLPVRKEQGDAALVAMVNELASTILTTKIESKIPIV